MSAELTSEQIVTKLLERNAVLKSEKSLFVSVPWANLGAYLDNIPVETVENVYDKYTFIKQKSDIF